MSIATELLWLLRADDIDINCLQTGLPRGQILARIHLLRPRNYHQQVLNAEAEFLKIIRLKVCHKQHNNLIKIPAEVPETAGILVRLSRWHSVVECLHNDKESEFKWLEPGTKVERSATSHTNRSNACSSPVSLQRSSLHVIWLFSVDWKRRCIAGGYIQFKQKHFTVTSINIFQDVCTWSDGRGERDRVR